MPNMVSLTALDRWLVRWADFDALMIGPVVRVGPNELSFIGADAWEDIYGVQVRTPPKSTRRAIVLTVMPL